MEEARIGAERIELRLREEGGAAACRVDLVRPGLEPGLVHSKSFAVLPRDVRACPGLVPRLHQALTEVDRGGFFQARLRERFPADSPPPGPEPRKLVRRSVELLAWWALLGSLLLLARGWRHRSPGAALGRSEILALVVLAAALRLLIPPVGPIHANGHGIRELGAYVPASLGPGDRWPDGPYGYAGAHLYRLLALLTGQAGGALLALWAALLALGAPLTAAAARALGGGRFAALFAGVGYAVLPILVRLAPTESPLVGAALLMLAAALAARVAFSSPRDWTLPFGLALSLAALAVQSHVVTVAWLVPAAIAPVLAPRGRRGRALLWVLALALLCAPHVLFALRSYAGGGAGRGLSPLHRLLETGGESSMALLNPFLVPLVLLPLTLLGILRGRWRVRLLAAALLLPWLPLSATVTKTLSDVLRYQGPLVLCALPFAALGAGGLVRRGHGTGDRRARAAALILVLALSTLPTLPLAWVADPEAAAVDAVRRAGERGLLRGGLAASRPREDGSPRIPTALPAWLLPAGAPRQPGPSAPVLIGTRCLYRPPDATDPTAWATVAAVDPGCASPGAVLEPLAVAGAVPEGFAGNPLWFRARRPGAPAPGVYRVLDPTPGQRRPGAGHR